jgi:DNA polymerase-1
MQEIFQRGLDFYSHIAIMTERLQGVSADKKAPNYLGKVNKSKRQNAKPYALGIPYGMSGYKLKFELNIEQEEADQLVANYLAAFPDLASWMQQCHAECYTKGYVTVETGRKRRFPLAIKIYNKYGEAILNDLTLWKKYHDEPGVYTEAKKARRQFKNFLNNSVNVKIQGLAASLINRACIQTARKFRDEGLQSFICLQVHDEIVSYGPTHESLRVGQIMQEVMENNYQISVPLKAEPQSSETYGGTK